MRTLNLSITALAFSLLVLANLHAQTNDELSIEYMSYLGGTGSDRIHSMEFDSSGNIYIGGYTTSSDFPVTSGAYDTSYNGGQDMFVCKLDPSGKQVIYCTYIGSTNDDAVLDLKVNSVGEVVVFGYNASGGFPVTPGAFDETYNGGIDDYVVLTLSADGSSLVYSTFFGGNANEHEGRLALDSDDNAYIFGITASSNIPTTAGAYQTTYGGGFRDAVLAKFSPTGSPVYCTYLGGSAFEYARAITINASGEAYLAGRTGSSNFPTTAGAYDQTNSFEDAYIAKISASGANLLYSTLIQTNVRLSEILIGKDGDIYAAGDTWSSGFDVTVGAYDTSFNGGTRDGAVVKFDSTLSNLLFSTFIGGSGDDRIFGMDIDDNDNLLIVGYSSSANYPITANALDATLDGTFDGVLTILDASGATLNYSTFIGSSSSDYLFYAIENRSDGIYIAGSTDGLDLPVTVDALNTTYNGGTEDSFVAKLASNQPPKYVVFQTTRDGNKEIYRMDEDGSNPINLTNNPSNDGLPSASPDGSRIAFASDRSGSWEIYSMDFYGNDLKQLTNGSISSFIPSYSPDGQKILYSSYVGGTSNAEIFVMDADGSNKQQLTTDSARDESPTWSPDGTRILFTRLMGAAWQLFSMDPDGSNQTQLTFSGNNRDMAWSPDGTQVVYDSAGGGIYKADIDPAATILSNTTLVTPGSNEGVPSWNPGNRILYQLGEHSIYVIDPDGSNPTLLTTSLGTNEYPRWLSAAFAEVSLPDTAVAYNQSISLPVSISKIDSAIVSAELFVTFDSALLTFGSVTTTGTLADGWTIEDNVAPGLGGIDTLKIAAATDNSAISTDGTLFHVDFQVADVRQPNSSALDIVHALLNDGSQEVLANDGSITIVGNDAQGSTDVATIIPRETITVTIIDADEDLDGAASTDQVTVSVANGAQTETLTLNETATPGEFSGSISTVFGLGSTSAANSSDGSVQAKAGDQIVFTFVDQLLGDGSGPANLNLLVNVIGGTDGSAEITQVTQPVDTIYLKVTDADLNTDSGVQETTQVVVTSSNGETETVTLTELDVDDEVFFGTLASALGAAGTDEDGTIHGIKGDVLTVTYDDVVTGLGDQIDRTDTDQVINPFGDADGNGLVQAFDAALILQHVLNPPKISGLELLQADVGDPFGSITPYDAALVLQKRVGLISIFPVQLPSSLNHPQPTPSSPKQIVDTRSLRLVAGEGYISVMADQREYIVSGDVLLKGIDGQVQLPEELGDFLVASRATDEGLRVVFAGAEGVEGPGELLRVYGVGPDGASLVRASFNDGSIVAWMDEGPVQNTPATYALHANTPNPFNPETVIAFDLPQDSSVRLEIYDALGQKVRTLVSGALATGAHRFAWDGRDARGSQVSSGVYFYRLQAGEYVQTRRMLLLK
jgi:hypothetical protein